MATGKLQGDSLYKLANEVGVSHAIVNPETAVRLGFREDYFAGIYGKIFRACLRLSGEGAVRSAENIAGIMKDDRISVIRDIIKDTSHLAGSSEVDTFVDVLRDRFEVREANRIIEQCQKDLRGATKGSEKIVEMISSLERVMSSHSESVSALDVLLQGFESLKEENDTSVKTTYNDLDGLMGGLRTKNLVLIAGRPGMGKTAFVLELLRRCEEQCALISLEQSLDEIAIRIMSNLAGISNLKLRHPVNPDVWDEITKVQPPAHMEFIDGTNNTLSAMHAHIRRSASRGCRIVAIDYLQLITPPKADRHDLSIGMISASLKQLAKQLGITIILICQLNRELEKRQNKKPKVSDLKDSGSLEQDADSIIFLYRPHVYNKKKSPTYCECIVAKNRHGPEGWVELKAELQYSRFTEVTKGKDEESLP